MTGRLVAGTGPAPADPDGAVTMAGGGGNTIGGCATPVVVCPTITLTAPPLVNGTVGVPYNQQLTATGGSPGYTFMLQSGALPNGLMLNGMTGLISGTPTTEQVSNFTITASDANGCLGMQAYTITIGLVFVGAPAGGSTLDVVGLAVLMILLVGAGLFVMNKLSL